MAFHLVCHWQVVLTQMAMLMVPAEFETGDDVVECEVFENETYALMAGWGPPGFVGQRLKYSNRKGELSSEEFPEVKLPGDFKWEDEWRVDKTYTTCDAEGWSYATTFNRLEQVLMPTQERCFNEPRNQPSIDSKLTFPPLPCG